MKVAVGRDYRDVAPNKGRWQGTGPVKETIDVSVHSEELQVMPPELAAEKMQSLGIPTYPTGGAIHREMAEHQIEIQQQQQQ